MQKIPGTVDFRDFQHASKTLWTEHKLRHAEPTSEGTLYQVRSEALSFWRTNLRPPAFLPNEFNRLGCESWSHVTLTWPLPFDKAPYLRAFVASSCITIATTTDLVASNHTSAGPSTAIRSWCSSWKGFSACVTIACSDALCQVSDVSRSCALPSVCKRAMNASRSSACWFRVWVAMACTVAKEFYAPSSQSTSNAK